MNLFKSHAAALEAFTSYIDFKKHMEQKVVDKLNELVTADTPDLDAIASHGVTYAARAEVREVIRKLEKHISAHKLGDDSYGDLVRNVQRASSGFMRQDVDSSHVERLLDEGLRMLLAVDF